MAKIQKKSKQQFHLIPFFYFPPKDCPSEGQLPPLGFAACQSKNCTNRANNILPQIFAEVFRGCSSPCCTNKANVHQHYKSPTDCKKLLAQDILPQIADMHRLGGYGIPAIPTQPQNYLPTEFGKQKRQVWNILPQIAQMCTD